MRVPRWAYLETPMIARPLIETRNTLDRSGWTKNTYEVGHKLRRSPIAKLEVELVNLCVSDRGTTKQHLYFDSNPKSFVLEDDFLRVCRCRDIPNFEDFATQTLRQDFVWEAKKHGLSIRDCYSIYRHRNTANDLALLCGAIFPGASDAEITQWFAKAQQELPQALATMRAHSV